MQHLSGMDASFLHLETPETPMHVGGMHTLELPKNYRGDFYEDFKQHISDRMHLSPVFTRKLALMPFELSNPVWVDDDEIDIDYHIRRIALPKPGNHQQLEKYVARLHSSLLDRSRPLWEFFVIEGLEGGRVALYTKVHHAGIDGQAGVALATAIMDPTPVPAPVRPPRQARRGSGYQLGMAELATAAVSNAFQQYVKLVKTFPDMARALQSVVMPQPGADGKRSWGIGKNMRLLGPKTPFNVAITNQRAYAGRSISLAESKQIARRVGVTLNDVVLGTCGGALRRYLADTNELPKNPLTAAVPVSLREQGNTDANNQVSMTVMTLATDVADPIERLKVINESSVAAKSLMGNFKAAIPTDFPSFGAPWLISGLASMYGRSGLANALPPVANVAVSNVPGATVPLYVCGALMKTYFPVSIPTHGVGLNITVQSYNGSLDYGLIACRRAVPDIADLADYLVEEHRKLHDIAMALPSESTAVVVEKKPAAKPARKTAPKRATPTPKPVAKAARKTIRKPRAPAATVH
jgi:diacylglycerol O-acyltransferase